MKKRLWLVAPLFVFLLAAGTTLHAQEPAEHAEEGGGELEVPDSLKWANFAILAVGLGYMLVKLLPKNFAERTATIQKEITAAQTVKRDAEARAAKVEAQVKSLGADIEKFRTEMAKDMVHEGERIRQETAAQMERLQAHAELEIDSAAKIARRQLREFSADLALSLAKEKVIRRLDANSEAALVDNFVTELGHQGSKN